MVFPLQVQLSRSAYASVAHRYWRLDWTPEHNRDVYGADASVYGIGNNLRLEPQLLAPPEVDEVLLDRPLLRLKSLMDHRCLFEDVEAFQTLPSTLERITEYLATELFAQPLWVGHWDSMTVWETARLGYTCRAGSRMAQLHFKKRNLILTLAATVDLETGLSFSRETLDSAVEKVFAAQASTSELDLTRWSQQLFEALKLELKPLQRLRIDLGRHQYLLVQSDS